MPFMQNDALSQGIVSNQIKKSAYYLRYLLISAFIVCNFIFLNFYLRYPDETASLSIWALSSSLFFIPCFLFLHKFVRKRNLRLSIIDLSNKLICTGIGFSFGTGVYLLHIYLPSNYDSILFYDTLYLSLSLTLSCLIFSLIYLTQRLAYFFLVSIPAIAPILLLQPINQHIFNQLFYFAFDFILVVICFSAFALNRMHRKLTKLFIRNEQLIQNAEKQVQYSQHVCNELNQEMQHSKNMEHQLHEYSQSLEQTIHERTHILEKQKQTIEMANAIASVHTWEWNLIKGTFEINNHEIKKLEYLSLEEDLTQALHPEDIPLCIEKLHQHFNRETEIFECEYRVKDEHDKWVWLINRGKVIQYNPETSEPAIMIGIFQNIDRQKQDHDRIQQAANIMTHVETGIVMLDEHLRYVEANPYFFTLSNLTVDQVLGKQLFEITDNYRPRQRSFHYSITEQLLKNSKFDGEFEEKFISGKELSLRLRLNAIRDEKQRIVNYVGIFSDLTKIKEQERRVSYLENYDIVTNLPNRFYYNYKTYQFLITNSATIQQIAIIRLSIDRFTALYEFLGNENTSELLKLVAQRLRLCNPNALMVAYLNREDFVIVYELNHVQPSIQKICEQINQYFHQAFKVADQELILTISIGVAIYPEHARQFEQLNNCAQQALNYARRLGGNTIQYYTKTHGNLYEKDVNLENELRQALRNQELEVYFQPQINLHDGSIAGFETLIRWNHPEKGLLHPTQFLPAAQQTSLISDIGEFVLFTAIAQLREWQDQGSGLPDIHLSINIDAQQLYRGQLLEHLDAALHRYSMPGKYIEFEITEASLIENTEHIHNILHQLKQRHIKLSLDDFGTGYSSMAYLTEFSFDVLKIDKSFVQSMHMKRHNAIINAIIAMGKAMDVKIVAEGIETQEQLDYLKDKQCDIAQGFYYAKPLNKADATQYLRASQHKTTPS
ncbi:GGDEF domain-containing phosphodiesterase [Acinetobacter sp. MB5]|uniref:bifunctional diguanylate cyclase/phosphodiesterase n=1 Tax=Acinetobacter sp. MB5 TaxID=2069438 RepID=UPI000DCFCBC5|nr:GGDEF domain-containing phosphodiesterase [Acinetobacter sp. MB5]